MSPAIDTYPGNDGNLFVLQPACYTDNPPRFYVAFHTTVLSNSYAEAPVAAAVLAASASFAFAAAAASFLA